ncbi:MAG: TIR domain-containing protein, partial [bacterium]|nr:TIR domain-containing protein [bacterium]
QVALQLALSLEEKGYPTWCYELDAIPGISHLDQTLKAIEDAGIFFIIISKNCVQSHEVTTELTRAQDHRKPIIPLLLDITHEEFSKRRPEWVQRLGTVTCSPIPKDIKPLIPRLILGLNAFKIEAVETDLPGYKERIEFFKTLLGSSVSQQSNDKMETAPPQQEEPEPRPAESVQTVDRQRKDPLKKELAFSNKANLIGHLPDKVIALLKRENLETQMIDTEGKVVVQAKKTAAKGWQKVIKSAMGLDQSISVIFEARDGDLMVTIMPTKWMDKAVGMGIGMIVFWPAAVTATWGIVATKQLISRIETEINAYVG